jgi:hypothetical protein
MQIAVKMIASMSGITVSSFGDSTQRHGDIRFDLDQKRPQPPKLAMKLNKAKLYERSARNISRDCSQRIVTETVNERR